MTEDQYGAILAFSGRLFGDGREIERLQAQVDALYSAVWDMAAEPGRVAEIARRVMGEVE